VGWRDDSTADVADDELLQAVMAMEQTEAAASEMESLSDDDELVTAVVNAENSAEHRTVTQQTLNAVPYC